MTSDPGLDSAFGAGLTHGGNMTAARRLFPGAPEPLIDLSTGINPHAWPIPPLAPEAFTRLPEPSAIGALEAVAAERYGARSAAHVVAAPGTQILLPLIAAMLPLGNARVLGPTYAEHVRAARLVGHDTTEVADVAALNGARVAVVVNPNNPDGRTVPRATLLAVRAELMVVDEAFAEVAADVAPGTEPVGAASVPCGPAGPVIPTVMAGPGPTQFANHANDRRRPAQDPLLPAWRGCMPSGLTRGHGPPGAIDAGPVAGTSGAMTLKAGSKPLCESSSSSFPRRVNPVAPSPVMTAGTVAADVRPGLVVLRSFGKFHGLAGVRLGFAIADPETAMWLRARLGPWAVSGPAVAIGTAALRDTGWAVAMRRRLTAESARLDGLLLAAGLTICGGTSLFRLVRGPADLFHRLGRAGIIVRRFAERPGYFRFGLPPDEAAWARLAASLPLADAR